VVEVLDAMSDDTDRLTASPVQATTCPNCACPMFPQTRCASCGWCEPHECPPTGVVCSVCVDEDDEAEPDEPTDAELRAVELGGSD